MIHNKIHRTLWLKLVHCKAGISSSNERLSASQQDYNGLGSKHHLNVGKSLPDYTARHVGSPSAKKLVFNLTAERESGMFFSGSGSCKLEDLHGHLRLENRRYLVLYESLLVLTSAAS